MEQFSQALGQLVNEGMRLGVPPSAIIFSLEMTKAELIANMLNDAKAQATAAEQPLIITPGGQQ